jgi:hypothetical protein
VKFSGHRPHAGGKRESARATLRDKERERGAAKHCDVVSRLKLLMILVCCDDAYVSCLQCEANVTLRLMTKPSQKVPSVRCNFMCLSSTASKQIHRVRPIASSLISRRSPLQLAPLCRCSWGVMRLCAHRELLLWWIGHHGQISLAISPNRPRRDLRSTRGDSLDLNLPHCACHPTSP